MPETVSTVKLPKITAQHDLVKHKPPSPFIRIYKTESWLHAKFFCENPHDRSQHAMQSKGFQYLSPIVLPFLIRQVLQDIIVVDLLPHSDSLMEQVIEYMAQLEYHIKNCRWDMNLPLLQSNAMVKLLIGMASKETLETTIVQERE